MNRSPLPPIWPEEYEDMIFDIIPAIERMALKNPKGVHPVTLAEIQTAKRKIQHEGHWLEEVELLTLDGRRHLTLYPCPPWPRLLDAQEEFRAALRIRAFPQKPRPPHFLKFGTFVEEPVTAATYDICKNMHFNSLPLIQQWMRKHLGKELVVTDDGHTPDQSYNELRHSAWHVSRWREQGRRVYVVDETLYAMLAHTELPPWPLDSLAFKAASFYVKLPKTAFEFGVWNPKSPTGMDVERTEGIMVTIDRPEPDTGKSREIGFIVIGVGNGQPHASKNSAYITVGLGPDGKLSDVQLAGEHFANSQLVGSDALRMLVPRLVFGLMLYLQSEHPDIEPVPPAAKRVIDGIKNKGKREKAIRDNAKQSRLGYLYIGGRMRQELEAVERSEARRTGRKLDHPVWVSGHWREQVHGTGRAQRKRIWIRPFRRGPDFAESVAIRAAKVPKAQPKGA